jgi:membrane-associated phospholipid phosphatase
MNRISIFLLLLILATGQSGTFGNDIALVTDSIIPSSLPADSAPSASPYHCSIKKEGALYGGELLGAGCAFALNQSIDPLSLAEVNSLSRNSINGFDRGATFHYSEKIDKASDYLVAAPILAPLLLFTDNAVWKSRTDVSLLYGEVLLASYVIPTMTKGIAQRNRPFVYNPDAPLDKKLEKDARVSFFSQHTTYAFSTACFLSTVYGDFHPGSKLTPVIWTASLAFASSIGVMRYESGMHFPTDILTGALVGSAIGCGIPWLHRIKNQTGPIHYSVDLFGMPLVE